MLGGDTLGLIEGSASDSESPRRSRTLSDIVYADDNKELAEWLAKKTGGK